MTKDEALRMALEALEDLNGMAQFFPDELYSDHPDVMKAAQAITAIKEALSSPNGEEQPKQEPVEVFLTDQHQMGFKAGVQSFLLDYWPDEQAELEFMKTQLLTAFAKAKAPQRTWVGLTDEEIKEVNAQVSQIPPIDYTTTTYAKAIEAKLKEKNT